MRRISICGQWGLSRLRGWYPQRNGRERDRRLQRYPIRSGWNVVVGDKAETTVWDWQEGGNLPTNGRALTFLNNRMMSSKLVFH